MLLNSWQKKFLGFYLFSIYTCSLIGAEDKKSLSLKSAFCTTHLIDPSVILSPANSWRLDFLRLHTF